MELHVLLIGGQIVSEIWCKPLGGSLKSLNVLMGYMKRTKDLQVEFSEGNSGMQL